MYDSFPETQNFHLRGHRPGAGEVRAAFAAASAEGALRHEAQEAEQAAKELEEGRRPSKRPNRYRTDRGEARVFSGPAIPTFAAEVIHPLVDGADSALAASLAANEAGRLADATYQQAREDHRELLATKPLTNDRELSERVVEAKSTAAEQAARAAVRALGAYDDLLAARMYDSDVQAAMATYALGTQDRVERALEVLEAAVREREGTEDRLIRARPAHGVIMKRDPLSGRYLVARADILAFDRENAEMLVEASK